MITAFDSETGRTWPSDKLLLANRLLDMRKNKSSWAVIAEVIDVWRKTSPREWKSYLVRLADIRESRKVTRVGTKHFRGVSRDKEHDALLSYLVDVPEWIVMVLRKLYTTEELPMDKSFFREFGRRFPMFLVRDKA